MPEPCIEQMLRIGESYGCQTVHDAYSQYMKHYDCFFNIADIDNQRRCFHNEMAALDMFEEYVYCGEPMIRITNRLISEFIVNEAS